MSCLERLWVAAKAVSLRRSEKYINGRWCEDTVFQCIAIQQRVTSAHLHMSPTEFDTEESSLNQLLSD